MSTATDLAELEAAIAENELDETAAERLRELLEEGTQLPDALELVLAEREGSEPPPALPEPTEQPTGEPTDKQLKALDRETQRHLAKVHEIMGGFVAGFEACSTCDGLGLEQPGPEPQSHESFRECPTCLGFAKVLTGSRDPQFAFAPCPGCAGRGFQERTRAVGSEIAQAGQAAPFPVPLPAAPPAPDQSPAAAINGGGDAWGVPSWMGDPNLSNGA